LESLKLLDFAKVDPVPATYWALGGFYPK